MKYEEMRDRCDFGNSPLHVATCFDIGIFTLILSVSHFWARERESRIGKASKDDVPFLLLLILVNTNLLFHSCGEEDSIKLFNMNLWKHMNANFCENKSDLTWNASNSSAKNRKMYYQSGYYSKISLLFTARMHTNQMNSWLKANCGTRREREFPSTLARQMFKIWGLPRLKTAGVIFKDIIGLTPRH